MTGTLDADGEGLSVELFACPVEPLEPGPGAVPLAAADEAPGDPDPDLTDPTECRIEGADDDRAEIVALPGIEDDPAAGRPAEDVEAEVEDGVGDGDGDGVGEVFYLFQAPPEVLRGPGLGVGGSVTDDPASQAGGVAAPATGVERGGPEDDLMEGGRGGDDLRSGAGDDTVHGGAGGDALRGGAGDDALYGDYGRDRLWGGAGDDVLHGGRGRDRLIGGGGDDTLYSDGGADRMFGGRGADDFVFDLRDGTSNTILIGDFVSGRDRLLCLGHDAPATEADFEIRPIGDGLSNTLLFGEVVATFDTARGEAPAFDDLVFA